MYVCSYTTMLENNYFFLTEKEEIETELIGGLH